MLKRLLQPLLKPYRRILKSEDADFAQFEAFCLPEYKSEPDKHVDTGVVIEYFDVSDDLRVERANWPIWSGPNTGSTRATLYVYQPASDGVFAKRLGVFMWYGGLIIVCSVFMGGCLLGIQHPEQLLLGPPNSYERSLYSRCRTTPVVETFSICRDGWESRSTGQGTCSWHGGVSYVDHRTRKRGRLKCVSEITRHRNYD